tara:strand:+ start:7784 stop:8056 length:273 start_codon:yes stop_codon:yes gene_type:complete
MPLVVQRTIDWEGDKSGKARRPATIYFIPSFGLKAKEIEHLWVFHTLLLFSDGFEWTLDSLIHGLENLCVCIFAVFSTSRAITGRYRPIG